MTAAPPELRTPHLDAPAVASAGKATPTVAPAPPVAAPATWRWQEPALIVSSKTRAESRGDTGGKDSAAASHRRSRHALPLDAAEPFVIGTHVQADVDLADPAAGARHLVLTPNFDRSGWVAEPGRSWLVVSLNKVVLRRPRKLRHGDVIELGRSRVRYVCFRDVLWHECGLEKSPEEQAERPEASAADTVRSAVGRAVRALARLRPQSRAVRRAAEKLEETSEPAPEDQPVPPPEGPAEPDVAADVAGRRERARGRARRGLGVLKVAVVVLTVAGILAVLVLLGLLVVDELGGGAS